MKIAAIENPRSRQEELVQFLTASPVADFMASMFGPSRSDGCATPRDRCGLLVKAIIEVFCTRWAPGAAILGIRDTKREMVYLNLKALAAVGVTLRFFYQASWCHNPSQGQEPTSTHRTRDRDRTSG